MRVKEGDLSEADFVVLLKDHNWVFLESLSVCHQLRVSRSIKIVNRVDALEGNEVHDEVDEGCLPCEEEKTGGFTHNSGDELELTDKNRSLKLLLSKLHCIVSNELEFLV